MNVLTSTTMKTINRHAPAKSLAITRQLVKDKFISLNPTDALKMITYEEAVWVHTSTSRSTETWENLSFRRMYLDKTRSIIANIKRDNSLLSQTGNEFVHMINSDMAPDVWSEAIRRAEKKRDMVAVIRAHD